MDSVDLPPLLVDEIAPILRVANEFQWDNPRISYHCRFYAFERSHTLEPRSSSHGVRQFKTALLKRLERENAATPGREIKDDAHDIQAFYLHYTRKYIQGLQNTDKADHHRTRLTKAYETAAVLFEVLKLVSLSGSVEVPDEILEAHKHVTEKAKMNTNDIFPLDNENSHQGPPRHLEISEAHEPAVEKAEMHTHNVLQFDPESSDQVLHREANHPKIPLQAIKDCTQDFNEKNIIGKGGFGRVYKGILTWADHVNQLVAVKRLDVTGFQGNKEFHTEVTMLSQYQHENIITLIGFYDDNKEMILVYEYASNGSLDTYLRDSSMSNGLSWPQLLKICIGVASALDYLHNHVAGKHRIIHRDIKSANVLLDDDWNAKLSDFGLARIGLANQQNTFVVTNLAGTHGYNDPQYEQTGYLSKESDVYSLGVVLFEALCGRLACVLNYHDERRFLHHLARTYYKNGKLDKIIDHRIRKYIKPRALLKFSAIAYQCLQETREQRPTIAEVVFQLEESRKFQFEDQEV